MCDIVQLWRPAVVGGMKTATVTETGRTLNRIDLDDDTVEKNLPITHSQAAVTADTSGRAVRLTASGLRSMKHNSTRRLRQCRQSSMADIQGRCGVKFPDDLDNINDNNNRKLRPHETSGVDEYDWQVRYIVDYWLCRGENLKKG